MSSLLLRARSSAVFKVAAPRVVKARVSSSSITSRVTAMAQDQERNVVGGPLELCCTEPMTGFHRDGFCRVSAADGGVHAVCAQVNQEFLDYSASKGNDLTSVVKPGQKWCLCVSRWKEAKVAGKAPPIILASTSEAALKSLSLEELKEHALDGEKAQK